jgi:hypothetical protein
LDRPVKPGSLIKVVYIGGYSRSGSTLLDCMLGQLPGFFSTGELAYVWTHGLQQNRLCGCGERFRDCPFWSEVGERGFGGWDSVDVEAILGLERAVNRHRFVPLLMAPRLWPPFARRLERYAALLARLYGAISSVSGSEVVVDSTIDPAYAFVLRSVPGLDVQIVHLTRDSRGTAFSWTRRQRRTDVVDSVEYQRRFHPGATAVRWVLYHLLFHALDAMRRRRSLFARYERVLDAPEDEILRIATHIGGSGHAGELSFLSSDAVRLKENHTVAGSLVRLRQGTVALHLDDEWRTEMGVADRRIATVLSWPLLRKYGYLGNPAK